MKTQKLELTTFDTTNCLSTRGSATKPVIGLNTKSGQFRINKVACELMKLKVGLTVKFHQDATTPEDWYLEVVKDKDGFTLREKDTVSPGGLILGSAPLAKKIFESVNCEKVSGHLQIGAEPLKFEGRTLWPLITALLTN